MPPTKTLFQTIWNVEQDCMPEIRAMCVDAQKDGKIVTYLTSVEERDAFARSI